MPRIAAVATATPPHQVRQRDIKRLARDFFADSIADVDRYVTIFDNSAIETRALGAPIQWFLEPHGLGEANDRYIEVACALGEQVAHRCLAAAGIEPRDV